MADDRFSQACAIASHVFPHARSSVLSLHGTKAALFPALPILSVLEARRGVGVYRVPLRRHGLLSWTTSVALDCLFVRIRHAPVAARGDTLVDGCRKALATPFATPLAADHCFEFGTLDEAVAVEIALSVPATQLVLRERLPCA